MKRKRYRDQEVHLDICSGPMAFALQEVGILEKGWCFAHKCNGWERIPPEVCGCVSSTFNGWLFDLAEWKANGGIDAFGSGVGRAYSIGAKNVFHPRAKRAKA